MNWLIWGILKALGPGLEGTQKVEGYVSVRFP